MTIEIVNVDRLRRRSVRLADYRYATKQTANSLYVISRSEMEDIDFKRPGKGLSEDSDILGQTTIAEAVSPDAVELYTFTVSRYGGPQEGPHTIFIEDEINSAQVGRLKWRPTQEGDYPPFEEGVVEGPTPRVLKGIRTALDQGARISGFYSGPGVRTISIEQDGKEMAYGEHASMDEAILIADKDFLAREQNYAYPQSIIDSQHTPTTTSKLDVLTFMGNAFEAYKAENGMIIVELKGRKDQEVPIKIQEQIRKHDKSFLWTDRGFTFESWTIPAPDGTKAIITKTVDSPEGRDPSDGLNYPIVKSGESNNFDRAVQRAFDADDEEIIDVHSSTPQDQITA